MLNRYLGLTINQTHGTPCKGGITNIKHTLHMHYLMIYIYIYIYLQVQFKHAPNIRVRNKDQKVQHKL